jgi:hypothetical protein
VKLLAGPMGNSGCLDLDIFVGITLVTIVRPMIPKRDIAGSTRMFGGRECFKRLCIAELRLNVAQLHE